MLEYTFEWDIHKLNINIKKHKISFQRASTIFITGSTITIYDTEHSKSNEDRWITMGIDQRGVVLVVVHTYYQINTRHARVRIISARKATKNEIKQYQTK